MTSFAFAHAGVSPAGPVARWDGWQSLADACLGGFGEAAGTLGLLYVTEPLAGDLDEVVAHVRRRTGIAAWVGAVAPAVCATGTDYFDTPAMAMMAFDLPADRFRVLPSLTAGAGDGAALSELRDWTAARQPGFGIVHADPRANGVLSLVPALVRDSQAYLVGGLTSAATEAGHVAGSVTGGGVSGVLFDAAVPVVTGLTQGCSPIGPVRTITGMEQEIVTELDGQPALEMFKEDVGELLARQLQRVAGYIHAALPVTGSDTGDYMVRNLMGIDANRGWLAIGAELSVGDQVMFVRRDAASAVADMERMLDSLKRRASSPIVGGVYHSCVARGPNQFGPGAQEMAMIREAFGDIPVIGFFGNGEISHDRLYTYTGVLSLFLER